MYSDHRDGIRTVDHDLEAEIISPKRTTYKITLLLIPLIFLSSCTIDWNDEKDKKIAELAKQVQELKSDKELELQKFEFEKQKYEESK